MMEHFDATFFWSAMGALVTVLIGLMILGSINDRVKARRKREEQEKKKQQKEIERLADEAHDAQVKEQVSAEYLEAQKKAEVDGAKFFQKEADSLRDFQGPAICPMCLHREHVVKFKAEFIFVYKLPFADTDYMPVDVDTGSFRYRKRRSFREAHMALARPHLCLTCKCCGYESKMKVSEAS